MTRHAASRATRRRRPARLIRARDERLERRLRNTADPFAVQVADAFAVPLRVILAEAQR